MIPLLLTLATACFTTARDHGWWDDEKLPGSDDLDHQMVYEIVPEKLTLVHSEISEALEDLRVGKMETTLNEKGKPEGFYSELADVVIRIYDLLGACDLEPLGSDVINDLDRERCMAKPSVALAFLHDVVSRAPRSWVMDQEDFRGGLFPHHLSRVVWMAEEICRKAGIDLTSEVQAKMAYNQTRSYRHGGKSC